MTGLVVVVTGAYLDGASDGVALTSSAFESVISWFPNVLAFAVFCFAFSTMISWSYYGERCWTTLFGPRSSIIYKAMFLLCTFAGPMMTLSNVLDFSDLMILGMALPNILGLLILTPKVSEALNDYWDRYTSGQMKPNE